MIDRQKTLQRGASTAADTSAIEQYQPGLYQFLIRRLRGIADAQDLAQDVYLRFLQVPHSELIRQPQAYLYRIAANLVNEFRLREKRQPITYDSEALEELTGDPAEAWQDEIGEQLNREQQVASFERVLAQLPPMYQAVLVLRARDGLTREEIAAELKLSPQTVKKYLFRALAYCRTAAYEPVIPQTGAGGDPNNHTPDRSRQ